MPKKGMTTRRGQSRGRSRWASIYLSGILCVVYACPRPCPWSILIPSAKTAFFRRGTTTTLVDYIGVPDGVPLLFRRPPRGMRPRGAFRAARRCRTGRRKASEHARWREYTLSTEGERPPRRKQARRGLIAGLLLIFSGIATKDCNIFMRKWLKTRSASEFAMEKSKYTNLDINKNSYRNTEVVS